MPGTVDDGVQGDGRACIFCRERPAKVAGRCRQCNQRQERVLRRVLGATSVGVLERARVRRQLFGA